MTSAPTAPDVGEMLLMLGATVNPTPVLATPETVTTTFPVVAADGTGATMLVSLQLVGVAAVPLNLIVLVPCVAPKFVPVMVTEAPGAPDVGERLEIVGVGRTVKALPLLATPETVTTTFPLVAPAGTGSLMLVALQVLGVPAVPLNLTVLLPRVEPKFEPVMVTVAPTPPEVGERLVMLGAANAASDERRKDARNTSFTTLATVRRMIYLQATGQETATDFGKARKRYSIAATLKHWWAIFSENGNSGQVFRVRAVRKTLKNGS